MVICINSYQHSDLLLIKARPKGVKATYNERTRKGRIKIDRLYRSYLSTKDTANINHKHEVEIS
jgi:hypothetical protein